MSLKATYTIDGQIPSLIDFIQGERPDITDVIGPNEIGEYSFKGQIQKQIIEEEIDVEDPETGEISKQIIEKEIEVELPIENIESLFALIPLYQPLVSRMTIYQKIQKDAIFGQQLITEFAVDNILSGIVDEKKTAEIRAKTNLITQALKEGFLNDALDEIKKIPIESKDEKFLTEDRLKSYQNKIEDRLEIPRTVKD